MVRQLIGCAATLAAVGFIAGIVISFLEGSATIGECLLSGAIRAGITFCCCGLSVLQRQPEASFCKALPGSD